MGRKIHCATISQCPGTDSNKYTVRIVNNGLWDIKVTGEQIGRTPLTWEWFKYKLEKGQMQQFFYAWGESGETDHLTVLREKLDKMINKQNILQTAPAKFKQKRQLLKDITNIKKQ